MELAFCTEWRSGWLHRNVPLTAAAAATATAAAAVVVVVVVSFAAMSGDVEVAVFGI